MSNPTFKVPFAPTRVTIGSEPKYSQPGAHPYVDFVVFPHISEFNKDQGKYVKVRDAGIRFFARRMGGQKTIENFRDSGFKKGQTVVVSGYLEFVSFNDKQQTRLVVEHIFRPAEFAPQVTDEPREQRPAPQEQDPWGMEDSAPPVDDIPTEHGII